ncbi:MAG: hypothetical protein WA117_13975 [Verrucomicrobiia bacterium]
MTSKKLTASQLAPMVADYHSAFPQLQLYGDDMLYRMGGLMAQSIWFDRLRTGAYRPTCRVHVLVAPSAQGGTVVLPQFLSIKVREITPQVHQRLLPEVVGALKSEILLPLDKPLDELAVAELLSNRSSGRPANAYALACLLAALGRSEEAHHWIGEYRTAIASLGLAPQLVDAERDAFLQQIEEWLKLPEREVRFAQIVKQQKARLLGHSGEET